MSPLVARRSVLAGLGAVLIPAPAIAKPKPIPAIPVAIRVATIGSGKDAAPVVSSSFLDDQLAACRTIFAEHELGFVEAKERGELPREHARLESRADRDALVDRMQAGVLNVFLVASLRDVDDPKLHRMGVTWRCLKNLKKKYVIVAASALETTMAHEIGHFLGLGHVFTKNNLMSYAREEGSKIFLDKKQGETTRRTARVLFATRELAES